MNRISFIPVLILGMFLNSFLFAEIIDIERAQKVAENKISQLTDQSEFQIKNKQSIFHGDEALFFVFELSPVGYIVISADTDLPPVIAYSFENNFTQTGDGQNPLKSMLLADLTMRKNNLSNLPEELILRRNKQWKELAQTNSVTLKKKGKQKDEILIQTNWGQGAPYNNFCPMDPVTNQRSIAGCPAVAMAQIVNYYQTLNETILNDLEDDYYHSYAGRNYWIDDDYEDRDFPNFSQLNAYLDTLEQCWIDQSTLKANEMAAMNFACGIAAKQVYTSEASGTFGVDQAYDAYLRFGFNEAILMDDSDTSMYTILAQNIMEGRPAHLAVVDPGWTMGHNVVVDGYTDEGYFHLNFGWNGSYNGFYLLPDEIPYGLTVIEGVVLNIGYPPVYTADDQTSIKYSENLITISPNPAHDYICIHYTLECNEDVAIQISDQKGALIYNSIIKGTNKGRNKIMIDFNQMNFPELKSGIYFCTIRSSQQTYSDKFIVR